MIRTAVYVRHIDAWYALSRKRTKDKHVAVLWVWKADLVMWGAFALHSVREIYRVTTWKAISHLWFLWMRTRIVLMSSALVACSARRASKSCTKERDMICEGLERRLTATNFSITYIQTIEIIEGIKKRNQSQHYRTRTSYEEGQASTYGSSLVIAIFGAFSSHLFSFAASSSETGVRNTKTVIFEAGSFGTKNVSASGVQIYLRKLYLLIILQTRLICQHISQLLPPVNRH